MIVATSAPTMSSLLTDLSTVATQVFSWVGDVATEITTQPILLLTTGFLVVGKSFLPTLKRAKTVNAEMLTPC